MRHGRMLGLREPFLWKVTDTVVQTLGDALSRDPRAAPARGRGGAPGGGALRGDPRSGHGEDPRVHDGPCRPGPAGPWTASSSSRSTILTASHRPRPGSVPGRGLDGAGREPDRLRGGDGGAARARPAPVALSGPPASGRAPRAIYQRLSAELAAPELPRTTTDLAAPARILAMVDGGRRRRRPVPGETVEVILDRTPAYAESGGQIGDTGTVVGRDGQGEILDTYYRGCAAHRAPGDRWPRVASARTRRWR